MRPPAMDYLAWQVVVNGGESTLEAVDLQARYEISFLDALVLHVAFHAEPRFTKDLGVWTEPGQDNAARVLEALRRFGAPLHELTTADLARPDTVFQIGVAPNRIDIVTGVDGVGFSEAWPGRAETTYGDQRVPVIGRRHLIQNKRASARPQDLLDLTILEAE